MFFRNFSNFYVYGSKISDNA